MKTLLLLLFTSCALAAPLNENNTLVTVTFDDEYKLVYRCQPGATGIIPLTFISPSGVAYPYIVRCGIGA